MASSKSAPATAGAAVEITAPASIRNVVLVGPSGSGKTTLVEGLLAAAGVLTRAGAVVEGTTVSDFDEAEIKQQRSVGLSLAPLIHDGVKINLLDAPGYADYVGEVRAGLRAADAAINAALPGPGRNRGVKLRNFFGDSSGIPQALASRSLSRPASPSPRLRASRLASTGQRRLTTWLRPPTTGPATPTAARSIFCRP